MESEAFRNQTQDQALTGLSFEERFGLIVDTEWSKLENDHLTRLIHKDGFTDTNALIRLKSLHWLHLTTFRNDIKLLSWERPGSVKVTWAVPSE